METPEINLEELKEQNFKERLEFVKKYAEWVKSVKNSEWSGQQAKIVSQ